MAGLGAAVSLHALAFAGLAFLPSAPPAPETERAPGASLAFYVFLAEGAESDAPLSEPPLADQGLGAGGEGEGRGAGVEAEADGDPSPDPELETEPEAEPAPEAEPEPDPDEAEAPSRADPSEHQTAPSQLEAAPFQDAPPVDAPADSAAPVPQAEPRPYSPPRDPDHPVATLQPERAEPGGAAPQALDIDALMAQVAIALDPDDFRMVQGAVASRLAVRDSFCLSSSDANREAGDCPEDGPAGELDLARFGLTGFGAVPPRFLEDMDRLEFELAQMGAGAGRIRRIMAELAEARRRVVNQPALTRQMDRDAADRTDHQGFRAPITPQRARDPSGEP